MAKKSFKDIAEQQDSVYSNLIEPQNIEDIDVPSEDGMKSIEKLSAIIAEKPQQITTQGNRSGNKAIRINMAFSPENYRFVLYMASIQAPNGKRVTMTQVINAIIQDYREHTEGYEEAIKAQDEMQHRN